MVTLLEHAFKELFAIVSVHVDKIVLVEERLDFIDKKARGRLAQKMEQLHFLTDAVNVFHAFVQNTQDTILLVVIHFFAVLLKEYLGDVI